MFSWMGKDDRRTFSRVIPGGKRERNKLKLDIFSSRDEEFIIHYAISGNHNLCSCGPVSPWSLFPGMHIRVALLVQRLVLVLQSFQFLTTSFERFTSRSTLKCLLIQLVFLQYATRVWKWVTKNSTCVKHKLSRICGKVLDQKCALFAGRNTYQIVEEQTGMDTQWEATFWVLERKFW